MTSGVFFTFFVMFHGVVCYLPWALLFFLSNRHWVGSAGFTGAIANMLA